MPDVTNSASGSFVDATGTTINFTYSGGNDHEPDRGAYGPTTTSSAVLYNFDDGLGGGANGIILNLQGPEIVARVTIDGAVVDLNSLVNSGQITLINGATLGEAASSTNWGDFVDPNRPAFMENGSNVYLQFNFTVTSLQADRHTFMPGPVQSDIFIACFSSGTLIKTMQGEVAIEDLRAGDRVLTMDAGYQPIRWIGGRKLDKIELSLNPKLKPIRIRADALGPGLPETDLLVSPQHRVLVRSAVAQRMFDAYEVLIPANKLLTLPGIDIEWDADEVEYFHMLFDAHQLVWSNGAVTESLFTGPEALKAVSPEAREEIATLFPEIVDPGFVPTPARPIPEKGKLMKALAQRLAKNGKSPQESHNVQA